MKTCSITTAELERTEKTIAKMVQRESFLQEIRDLEKDREIHRKYKLQTLDPVLNNEGLIRVGGRLQNAAMSEDQKHQIILPAKHFVTNLIMKSEHMRLHHSLRAAIDCCAIQVLAVERSKRILTR